MGGLERAEITFGQTTIPFVIKRNTRGVNVTIRINPDGVVHVGAPERATTERIKMIVAEKAPWILEKLAAHGQRRADLLGDEAARTFSHGDRFLYLGEPLTLALDLSPTNARAATRAEHIPDTQLLQVRGVAPLDPKPIRAALVVWFVSRASAHLPGLTAQWAARLGVSPSQVLVVDQKSRWGSCSHDGIIRLNWRIIGAPLPVIDYLIAHELTHIHHPDHSPRFWNALAVHMPDHTSRRATLKRLGPALMW